MNERALVQSGLLTLSSELLEIGKRALPYVRLVGDSREDRRRIELNSELTPQRTAADTGQGSVDGDLCDDNFGTSAVEEALTLTLIFLSKLGITVASSRHRRFLRLCTISLGRRRKCRLTGNICLTSIAQLTQREHLTFDCSSVI
ncbi:hypothetical protein MTO96_035712 [Rhipicephalus appendiculatus]